MNRDFFLMLGFCAVAAAVLVALAILFGEVGPNQSLIDWWRNL